MSKQEKRIRHIAEQSLLGNCQIRQFHVFHLSRVRLKFLYLQWEQHPPCWCSLQVDPCQWKGPVCFRLSLSVNWSEVTEALAREQAQEGRLWNQLLSILTYPKYLDMLLCMTLVRIPAIKVLKVSKKSTIISIFIAASHHPEIWAVEE